MKATPPFASPRPPRIMPTSTPLPTRSPTRRPVIRRGSPGSTQPRWPAWRSRPRRPIVEREVKRRVQGSHRGRYRHGGNRDTRRSSSGSNENPEPDLAGYAIVYRSTTAPYWEKEIFVGNVTEYTMEDVSIDDLIFGVKAIDKDGNESLVSAYADTPRPKRMIEVY